MTHPRLRRHRSRAGRKPAFSGDFPDDGQAVTELLRAAGPAGWDGTTIEFTGASGAGLPGSTMQASGQAETGILYMNPGGPRTEPLARLRAQPGYSPPAPAMFPALPGPPAPAAAPPGQRDTGPQQRLPRMTRVRERPRPGRDPDCAIFAWSALLGQHIMLCGTCPPERRNRYADPIAGHMPFAFESLRVSAHVSGWRLDAFTRWACPACQLTAAWHAPHAITHSHPQIRRRKLDGEHVSPYAEATAIAIREHDLILDVAAAASHGRHRAGAR